MKRLYSIINSKQFSRLCLILAVMEMIVIFILSSMSGNMSHGITNSAAEKFGLKETHIITEEGEAIGIDASSQNIFAGLSVRKFAHIGMYAILGGLVFFAVSPDRKLYQHTFLSIITCYIYALTDEFHQYFVPGRTGLFTDTLVDAIGFIISSFVLWGICFLINRRSV